MRTLQLIPHLNNVDLHSTLVNSRGTLDYSRWQLLEFASYLLPSDPPAYSQSSFNIGN